MKKKLKLNHKKESTNEAFGFKDGEIEIKIFKDIIAIIENKEKYISKTLERIYNESETIEELICRIFFYGKKLGQLNSLEDE